MLPEDLCLAESFERLKFVGDAVARLVVRDLLSSCCPIYHMRLGLEQNIIVLSEGLERSN
jgi:hypothetical protein